MSRQPYRVRRNARRNLERTARLILEGAEKSGVIMDSGYVGIVVRRDAFNMLSIYVDLLGDPESNAKEQK